MVEELAAIGERPGDNPEELKRVLGPFLIFALSFGSIMGTGMFFGASIGAQWGGAASILAWLILLPITLYIASCFGELSSMFPKAGGIYEFSKQAYGRLPSFFVGWLGWVAGNFSNTVVVVAGVDYLLPQEEFVYLRVGFSILVLILLNLIAFFGVEESGKVVSVLVGLTIVVVIMIVIFGALNFEPGNFSPFFSSGWLPVLVATFLLIESFDGELIHGQKEEQDFQASFFED